MSFTSSGEFEIGAHVVLQGLNAGHMNGRTGKVATSPSSTDGGATVRQGVDLFNPWKDPATGQLKHERLMVKIENLDIFRTSQAYAPKINQFLSNCWNCNKSEEHESFMVCSKCRISQYCSKDCQAAHWRSNHKLECKGLRAFWKKPDLKSDDAMERSRKEESFACILLERGEYSKAETHFKEAIEALKPLGRGALFSSLGMSLAFQNRFDEAKTAYEKATRLLPMDSRIFGSSDHQLSLVHANFGALCKQTGDFMGGVQKYKMAVELDPLCGRHYHGLATCYEGVGRFREAAEAWEKFMALCPEDDFLGMAYGYCAQDLRRDLLEKQGTYSPAEQKQQEAKMEEMIHKAFEIDPNLPFFRNLSKRK